MLHHPSDEKRDDRHHEDAKAAPPKNITDKPKRRLDPSLGRTRFFACFAKCSGDGGAESIERKDEPESCLGFEFLMDARNEHDHPDDTHGH